MPLQRQSACDSYMPLRPAHQIWYGDALKAPVETKPAATPPPEGAGPAKGRLAHN